MSGRRPTSRKGKRATYPGNADGTAPVPPSAAPAAEPRCAPPFYASVSGAFVSTIDGMSEETPLPVGPWQQRARTVLRLWCWFVFCLIVFSFVMGAISGSALTRNPMAGVWWLVFGGYALKKGGLLDLPGGHRKAAWVAGALTLLAIISIAYGPGHDEIVVPAWVYALRAAMALSTAVLTIALIMAAREVKDPSPFETWPPCRPDRRRSASVAALIVAAAFMILGSMGFAGFIPLNLAIPGSIGALVCTIFLIRGVTCRPAPL